MCLKIVEITNNKEDFIDILLVGDEQESMILKYLEKSMLFALYEAECLKSVCAIIQTNQSTIEIKNLATYPEFQNNGYATFLLNYIFNKYKNTFKYIMLGTGENNRTLSFYKKRGFVKSYIEKEFFTKNYDHPIYENGTQLVDMIVLKKEL